MIEGPIHRFRQYEIVQDINKNGFYLYFYNTFVARHETLALAKNHIIKINTGVEAEKLTYPGVEVLSYEFNGKLYLLSVKEEFVKMFPKYSIFSEYELKYKAKVNKYLHNEKGPANLGIDDGVKQYFLDGKLLGFKEWEKKVFDKNFNNKLEDLIDED